MIKVAICGSATGSLDRYTAGIARGIGAELVRNNVIIFTGATTGFSYEGARGAVAAGGLTVGISPAENLREHTGIYGLPVDAYKILIFTGLGYKARDVVMIRSVDAVIFIGGGVGTIAELCSAIDYEKVIGALEGSGGATSLFSRIAEVSSRHTPHFISENNPKLLVKKVIRTLCQKKL